MAEQREREREEERERERERELSFPPVLFTCHRSRERERVNEKTGDDVARSRTIWNRVEENGREAERRERERERDASNGPSANPCLLWL